VDEIYHFFFVGPLIRISVFLWRIFDDILVDGTVNGVAALVRGSSEIFKRLQSGYVQNYALSILVGIVFMIGYIIFGK
jgi:NADH-quinone oxidoreductase subunit L